MISPPGAGWPAAPSIQTCRRCERSSKSFSD
jgi:hypothetical protein